MDIRHLQYFLEVAKHQSFTKAAEALYITQPTISKLIKNLEEELGILLFERVGKRVELTDAGEVLLQQAQGMVQSFEHMTVQLGDLLELKHGRIRMGLPPMIGASYFPKMMGMFRQKYPGIQLELFEDGAKKVEAEVEAGHLDIGVVLLPTKPELFDMIPFVEDQLMIVVHADHPLLELDEVRLKDLEHEPFLLFREDFALHDRIIEECRNTGFEPNIMYKSSQWDFISEMAAAKLGIALLPNTICKELTTRQVRIIPLKQPVIPWHLAMVWRKDRYLSFAAREWIRFSKTMLGTTEEGSRLQG
ncbi:cidABC operon transcriptional activator CidR [Marinicrinis lubricantis]|uniref:CidABC operon transcriptional activator CidR n=1 Tax=Marinicrinis lubricantis TaxID=2086470 RepID=A0ABW1IVI7_9BACL